ncbi:hypothetical protein GCM10010430_51930 [Kitasatospora cystarginea]|uniref:Uncharacterized protein n=1 Tax=Kitasatospora cystarginea TaxID=58350 RepID=A0ABN3EKJ7_9ACTN
MSSSRASPDATGPLRLRSRSGVLYTHSGDPGSERLGLLLRAQRAGDVVLARPTGPGARVATVAAQISLTKMMASI